MRLKLKKCIYIALLISLIQSVNICAQEDKTPVSSSDMTFMQMSCNNPYNGIYFRKPQITSSENIFRTNFAMVGETIKDVRSSKGKAITTSNGTELVLNNGKIMVVYKDNPKATKKYIDVLNEYAQRFSGNSNIYAMLIPTQIEFDGSKFGLLSDSQKDTIDHIYSSLSNIKTVNVYDTLEAHKSEYLYFRTDHHWTQRGGYYAYQSFMNLKGEPVIPLGLMKQSKITGFLGYLYDEANAKDYAAYADEIEYFEFVKNYPVTIKGVEKGIPFQYQKNMYSVPSDLSEANYGIFLDGDHQYAEITTDNKNGQVALVIKDSYANAVIPFLAIHYEKIIIVDPRSYTGSVTNLTNKHDFDDIIFINNATVPTLPLFVEYMENIL